MESIEKTVMFGIMAENKASHRFQEILYHNKAMKI